MIVFETLNAKHLNIWTRSIWTFEREAFEQLWTWNSSTL